MRDVENLTLVSVASEKSTFSSIARGIRTSTKVAPLKLTFDIFANRKSTSTKFTLEKSTFLRSANQNLEPLKSFEIFIF